MYTEFIQIDNCLGFDSVKLNLKTSGITKLGGPNGSGKSSIILAMQMALCGRSGCVWRENTLNRHTERGGIHVRLRDCDCLMEPSHLDVRLDFTRFSDGEIEEEYGILDSTGEYCPEPRTTLRRLRDTSDLELESPLARRRRSHSAAIMGSLEGIQPREFKTYICSNATFLDQENFKTLEKWSSDLGVQVLAELHHGMEGLDFVLSRQPGK